MLVSAEDENTTSVFMSNKVINRLLMEDRYVKKYTTYSFTRIIKGSV